MSIMRLQCKDCERRLPPGLFHIATYQCQTCWRKSTGLAEQRKNREAEEMVR